MASLSIAVIAWALCLYDRVIAAVIDSRSPAVCRFLDVVSLASETKRQ